MSLTASTGYVLAQHGQLVPCTVPGTRVVLSRVRFKGKTIVDTWSDYRTSNSNSVSFPTNWPAGYSLDDGSATFSMLIEAGPTGFSGTLSVSAPGGSNSKEFSLGPNQTQTVSVSTDCSGSGTATGGISYGGGSGSAGSPYILARAYAKRERLSTNPQATVGSQVISGPATLADGIESAWYSITAGNLLPGDNQVLVNVEGSLQVWLEVEYTYDPYPPAPTRNQPENLAVVDNRQQPFELILNGATGSSATQYHARIAISQSPTLSNPITADSSQSLTGWQKWTGSAWAALTSTGVTAGSRVRYIPPSPLPLGVLYWTAQTKDNWGYGLVSSVWTLRMVLSVDSLEGYALAIESVQYPCLDLAVNLTCNGKIGTIRFIITNSPDSQGVRNNDRISYGDTVDVSLYDSGGAEEQYRGRVWQKNPGDVALEVVAALGDKVPSERILKADYPEQDIGTSMVTAIDTYCAPVLSAGIPNPLGIIGNLMLRGKPAVDLFREAMKVWGLRWWVETEAVDWVCHVVDPKALSNQGIIVRYGEGE